MSKKFLLDFFIFRPVFNILVLILMYFIGKKNKKKYFFTIFITQFIYYVIYYVIYYAIYYVRSGFLFNPR